MNDFIAKLIASFIERAVGNKHNTILTIAGIIGAIAVSIPNFTSIVPANDAPVLVVVGLFLTTLAAALGYGKKQ